MLIKESQLKRLIESYLVESIFGKKTKGAKTSTLRSSFPNFSKDKDIQKVLKDAELLGDDDINTKPGVDIESLSEQTKDVIKIIFAKAKEMKVETPVVTSGYRGPKAQISAMYKNWKNNGGLQNKARAKKYLVDLYKDDDLVINIHKLFARGDKKGAIKLLKKNPISSHQSGSAFDLRFTNGIDKVLNDPSIQKLIKPFGKGSVKESDHYHIAV